MITLVVESCRDELVRKYMYNIFEVFVALKSTENNIGMVQNSWVFFSENMT